MSNDDESQPRGDHWRTALTTQLQTRNHLPPHGTPFINTLPTELLVQIIEEVHLGQNSKGSGTYRVASRWALTYQLVCCRWRDVIRSTPSLWQDIIVYEGAEWLEFCLRRCAGALATVHVWHPTLPEKTFATLGRHASSIKAYYVHCDVPQLDDLSGLPLLLAVPMPALETLSLDGPYYENLDVPITHDLVPRLTTLDLTNCTAPRDIAVYTPLRKLSLCGSGWTFSYDKFLDLMVKCLALEHLSLDEEILDRFSEELADPPLARRPPPRTTPVVLPRLKTMELGGQPAVLFRLLATIHAPQARRIEHTSRTDYEEPGPLFTRLVAPNPQLRYPFLSAPCAISLSCWDRAAFRLSVRGGPDSSSVLSIGYGIDHNEDWPGNANLERNLVALMDFFSVAAVDTLELEGYLGEVAVESWQRVFQTLPRLRRLRIRGRRTFDSLWLGLQRATQASLERDGAVCCPSLSEIVVNDPPWHISRYKFDATVALFDLIPAVLRARAAAGGARLKKFQLYLQYTDELWSQTSELRDGFMENVKALVDELDYRDGRT